MNLQPSKSMNTSRFLGRVTIAFVYSMRCTGDGVSVGAQQQQNDHALSWKVNIATGTLKRYQENSFCWISMGPQIEIGSQMYTQQEAGNCCLMHFITLTYCVSNVKKCIYFKNVEGHKTKLKIKRLLPTWIPYHRLLSAYIAELCTNWHFIPNSVCLESVKEQKQDTWAPFIIYVL